MDEPAKLSATVSTPFGEPFLPGGSLDGMGRVLVCILTMSQRVGGSWSGVHSIFGSARKLSFFAGKMRVVHSGYEPLTVEVNTPIVVETLKPVQ